MKVLRFPVPSASADDSPELAAARELRARWGLLGSLLVARYVVLLAADAIAATRGDDARRDDARRALERLRVAFRSLTRSMRLMLKGGA